jgi:hypothetical protein
LIPFQYFCQPILVSWQRQDNTPSRWIDPEQQGTLPARRKPGREIDWYGQRILSAERTRKPDEPGSTQDGVDVHVFNSQLSTKPLRQSGRPHFFPDKTQRFVGSFDSRLS